MIDREKYFPGGNFLKPADVAKTGAAFTIAKFEEQRTRLKDLPIQPVLWFEGVDKPFPLNATNLDTMIKLHGRDDLKWPGKKVTLIHAQAPNPSAGGRMQDALRVKS
jgi:hypothetical protein